MDRERVLKTLSNALFPYRSLVKFRISSYCLTFSRHLRKMRIHSLIYQILSREECDAKFKMKDMSCGIPCIRVLKCVPEGQGG